MEKICADVIKDERNACAQGTQNAWTALHQTDTTPYVVIIQLIILYIYNNIYSSKICIDCHQISCNTIQNIYTFRITGEQINKNSHSSYQRSF